MNFYEWLTGTQHEDENTQKLADKASMNSLKWRNITTENDAKKIIAEDITLYDVDKGQLTDALANAWKKFPGDAEPAPAPQDPEPAAIAGVSRRVGGYWKIGSSNLHNLQLIMHPCLLLVF